MEDKNAPLDPRWIFEPVEPEELGFAYEGSRPNRKNTGIARVRGEGNTAEEALHNARRTARGTDIGDLIADYEGY